MQSFFALISVQNFILLQYRRHQSLPLSRNYEFATVSGFFFREKNMGNRIQIFPRAEEEEEEEPFKPR